MRLRYVLILMFTALALTPVAFFRAWPNTAVFDTEIGEVRDQHLLLARTLASSLEQYHRSVRNSFELVIATPEIWKHSQKAANALSDLGFRHICIVDPSNGRVTQEIATPGKSCPAVISNELRNSFESLPPEGVSFSEVTQAADGQNILHVTARLSDGHIAYGTLTTSYFVELGKAVSFGKRGYAAIVDQAGNVLYHPHAEWSATPTNIATVSVVKRMMNGETGTERFYSPALKSDMVVGFASVSGVGWAVMIPQPIKELHDKADFAQSASILVLVIGLSGAFLLALLVSVLTSRPLEQISSAARLIASGESYDPAELKTQRFLPRELRELHDSFRDMVAKLRDLIAQSNDLAFSDSLTQLANREAFRRYLAAQINDTKGLSEGTLMFIDLDGFKSINDTKGHDVGDAVLVDVARKICRLLDLPCKEKPAKAPFLSPQLRLSGPIAARLGGDEFAVFLPGESRQAAQEFAEDFLQSLTQPTVIGDHQARVGASIGIASFPEHGQTFSDLLKAADLAMYEAKRVGKNQVCHFDEEIAKSHDTLSGLGAELSEGFSQGQFDVHFQPVYNAQDFTLSSVEALLRWHHPTLGLLEAENFLEPAKRFGFQLQIDTFTFEHSLAALLDLALKGARLPALSMNVWTESLLNQDYVNRIIENLPRFPCPLSFELVNTKASDARIAWALDQLREAGVGIGIDDFGIETSSILSIADLRPTDVKIDSKLIARVRQNGPESKLVASIIEMAHAQNVRVTAEGIETLDQAKALQAMGCDFLQGYALNSPMTARELFHCLTAAPPDTSVFENQSKTR